MWLKNYFVPSKEGTSEAKTEGEIRVPPAIQTSNLPAALVSPIAGSLTYASSAYPSPYGSRPSSVHGSLYGGGDFRNGSLEDLLDIKCDIMVNWLHSRQEEHLWTGGEPEEGVCLKKSRGQFACAPQDLSLEQDGFYAAIKTLNVKVRNFSVL